MKLSFWKVATVFVLYVVVASCANYKMHLDSDKVSELPADNDADRVVHRLYLIGDAGLESDVHRRNLTLVRQLADRSDAPYSCVYLGDNIYPSGMPSQKDLVNRPVAESVMLSQMRAMADGSEQVLFIGGNHDWHEGKKGALKAIKRQAEFIEEFNRGNVRFSPEAGCPGPEVIELSPNAVLILVDSQWWLQDWSSEKDINEDCDMRTRFDFVSELTNAVNDHREKQIIIATHHPAVSAGSHGGYFTWKDHLFPLTNVNKKLYIPLPVIGSLYPVLRSTYGHVQDEPHPKYREYVQALLYAVEKTDNVVFVSGHEHALEYHQMLGHHFLVSGSGAKTSPVGNSPTTVFGHGTGGFMEIEVLARAGIRLKIWEPDEEGNAIEPVFQNTLVSARKPIDVLMPDLPVTPDTDSTIAVISEDYAKNRFYRKLFGERYRNLYDLPVKARNISLTEEHGGLTPIKKGGGLQTNSLRFESPEGQQYVLRSLNKDASRLLPRIYQSTFANDILQDQFTASHPYAAFIVPDMADAVGVYHTNPQLVYLKRQQALGRYNSEFNEALYLYEERPDEDWSGEDSFGNSNEIVSVTKVVEQTMKSFENYVDQPFTLRSRLFDMLIGDWDRHDDQWRWAQFDRPDGKGKIFRPIPRDRDQALSNYDGFLISIANWYTPGLRRMSTFTDDMKRVKWFNFNARYFDRDFLNKVTLEEWVAAAEEVKAAVTDEVIDEALSKWPEEVFAEQGAYIAETLKGRRDNLPEFAREYYKILAKRVFIRGTEDADFVDVIRMNDSTIVRVYDSNKEDDRNELYYERTLYDNQTNSVEIYGLDGQDNFEISGDGNSNILFHLVGGEGKDEFMTDGDRRQKRVRAYDTHTPNKSEVPFYKEVDDDHNTYERLAFKYNYGIPLIKLGWNPDDGALVGGGAQWVRYGFKKEPFASRHSVLGSYSFGSKSFSVSYLGEWKEVLGKAGIDLDAQYQGRSYVENYFGFGNDVEIIGEARGDELDYYRVKKRSMRIVPALTYGADQGNIFRLNFGAQSHKVDSTADRFITAEDNGLPVNVFKDRRFGIVGVDYSFVSVDDQVNTGRGIRFNLKTGVEHEWDLGETHTYLSTSLALYFRFRRLGQPVLATRIGGEWHWGEYQFYQSARLGDHANFRGMPKHRLAGDRMFYQNIDFRINLLKWRSYYIPTQMGLVLNFDHGRVWLDGEESDTWHYAWGGGIWLSPFQSLLLSLTYNVSDLDQRFNFQMGFFF